MIANARIKTDRIGDITISGIEPQIAPGDKSREIFEERIGIPQFDCNVCRLCRVFQYVAVIVSHFERRRLEITAADEHSAIFVKTVMRRQRAR